MISLPTLVLALFAANAAPHHEAMRPVMGTFARVEIAEYGDAMAAAADAALEEIERLDGVMSNYKANSDLTRLNRAGGASPVEVCADLYRVLELSLYYHRRSGGAFDVTVAPLVDLWKGGVQSPAAHEVSRTRGFVGSDRLHLDSDTRAVRYERDGVEVDLGAIGKGYAVDRAVEVLRGYDVASAVVDLGRTLYCIGSPAAADGWPVGIAHPLDREAVVSVLHLRDRAVSTSGNYESTNTVGGKRVSHIIDPRTGYPVENDILSVTVVAEDATAADALSTAVFVLGVERGLRLIEGMPGVEALIFYRTKENYHGHRTSKGFEIEWVDAEFSH